MLFFKRCSLFLSKSIMSSNNDYLGQWNHETLSNGQCAGFLVNYSQQMQCDIIMVLMTITITYYYGFLIITDTWIPCKRIIKMHGYIMRKDTIDGKNTLYLNTWSKWKYTDVIKWNSLQKTGSCENLHSACSTYNWSSIYYLTCF